MRTNKIQKTQINYKHIFQMFTGYNFSYFFIVVKNKILD